MLQKVGPDTPMGATLLPRGGAAFRTWGPAARDVYVVTDAHASGHGAGWMPDPAHRLFPLGDGTWAGFMPWLVDGDPYLFWVRGPEMGTEGVKRDPYARELGTQPPGGAIVAGVPYGCADTVIRALESMNPGVDRKPEEWRQALAGTSGSPTRYPPVSIWHGDADERVVPRNRIELIEQWTAAHGLTGIALQSLPANGTLLREIYADASGTPKVESVVVKALGHAFPIRIGGATACGRPGDFVVDVKVCAASEIARFWGLEGNR